MIFEEVPLRLCVNELASVLLHQCGLSSLCIGETTTVVNPITTLVLSTGATVVKLCLPGILLKI